ncbi:dynactin subunit 3-like [Dendronephthya gigantea]|uniref:dynactin subunit 3-like n=1 Tax=Dendronephthya gigantea TaxID=151771 RepID=UPI00106BC2F6|nr:dynactin subunit 3-like [Dendronephthya gigantea]
MAASQGVAMLEERIQALEKRIISSNPEKIKTSCADVLAQVNQNMNKITTRYSKVGALWKRLNELQDYLTPEFIEKLTLTDESKADIILASEQQLRTTAEQFQTLEQLKNVPSEATFKDLPEWSSKLQPLVQVNVQQLEEVELLDEEVCELLVTYNNIINSLSRQFQEWENIICELEYAAQRKTKE